MEFWQTPAGIWTGVGIALALGALVIVIKNLVFKERHHMNEVGGALNEAGSPTWFTEPIFDLAVGDKAAAVGAAFKAAQRLKTPAGKLEFLTGMVGKAMSDPAMKPAMLKLAADITGGAAPDQVAGDLQGVFAAGPLSKVVGKGPLLTDLGHVSDMLQRLKANPALAALQPTLGSLPAHLQSLMLTVADAAHSLGSQSVIPAPVEPAPATGNALTIPEGHSAIVTKNTDAA